MVGHLRKLSEASIDNMKTFFGYFTEFTRRKAIFYGACVIYVLAASIVAWAELFINIPCPNSGEEKVEYPNPAYDGTKCPHTRHALLLFMNHEECGFGRQLVASVLLGGMIGWERRQADRPAGIRTMSLVSLGSCLFTINSAFAFRDGPMTWDASRVSAAIPSGVGFLGAGLIFKKEEKHEDGESSHIVHGLTTAASLWLSAAVGIACGGDLYFAASFAVAVMMLLLRFGPRQIEEGDEDDHFEEEIAQILREHALKCDPMSELTPVVDAATGMPNSRSSLTTYATIEGADPSVLATLSDTLRQAKSIRKRKEKTGLASVV